MRTIVGLLTLALTAGACGDDGGGVTADARPTSDAPPPPDAPPGDASIEAMLPETLPDPLPTGDPDVTLVTANTALPPTIKYAAEREPQIIDALNALDADVLCVQEVWDVLHNQDHGNVMFYQQIKDAWPYAYWSTVDTESWGNGLLLLSKHPMYRGRQIRFDAQPPDAGDQVLDRMAIAADVVTDDSYFHVICTHLHHATDDPGETIQSQTRQDEIDEINAWAMTEGYWDGPTFLIGDFNTGPQMPPSVCEPDCTETDEASWQYALQNWTDPNETWDQCTWCVEHANPMQLLAPDPDFPDERIDHCLYRGIGTSMLQSRRVLADQPITVEHPTEGTVQTYLSDHLWLECIFAPPAP